MPPFNLSSPMQPLSLPGAGSTSAAVAATGSNSPTPTKNRPSRKFQEFFKKSSPGSARGKRKSVTVEEFDAPLATSSTSCNNMAAAPPQPEAAFVSMRKKPSKNDQPIGTPAGAASAQPAQSSPGPPRQEKARQTPLDVTTRAMPEPAPTPIAKVRGENHKFYGNLRKSRSEGAMIENILRDWHGDYAKLEKHHHYIQWLFPVYENGGMNTYASALSKNEAAAMRADLTIARRIQRSYKLILDFFGFRIADDETGALAKHENWKARFRNLNSHTHNNLRISRILVSLGELGFGRYKAPMLSAFQAELSHLPSCAESLRRFWAPLVREEDADWYRRKTREAGAVDRGVSVFFDQFAA